MASGRKHILPSPELELPKTLHEDRHKFEVVDVPVVTTSASFRSDIAHNFGESVKGLTSDIVFSRAHFSMSVAIMRAAREKNLSTWLIDPINYVTLGDWKKLVFLARVGKLTAGSHFLKHIKDIFDTIARGRSPLTQAITAPLLYANARVNKPIISLHYEAGNILAKEGKKVLQIVTDPHIRPQYLYEAERPNITFAVFDENTKQMFLESARGVGKQVNPERVVVTGPPVDPRIVSIRKRKDVKVGNRSLRLAITTGGLGQNKEEIKKILRSLAPQMKTGKIKVVLYASTLPDFREMYENIAREFDIEVGNLKDETAVLRILYYPSILDANESLIDHIFPWAHGFVTKPSGDMAYDAVGAGCFLLLLEPWGEWEENIGKIFIDLGIAQRAQAGNFSWQVDDLLKSTWVEKAIRSSLNINNLFLNGAKEIVDLQQRISLQ